jgi:hypothetical protein
MTAFGGFRRQNALCLFAFLQLADFLTTLFVLQNGGVEANPVVQSLMPWMGTVAAVALCKLGLVSVTWLVARRQWVLLVGNSLYVVVVGWNVFMITLAVRGPGMAGG